MLSVSFVLPVLGKYYDQGIAQRIPAGETVASLAAASAAPQSSLWMSIQASAGLEMLGRVAVLPLILFFIFLALKLTGTRAKAPEPAAASAH